MASVTFTQLLMETIPSSANEGKDFGMEEQFEMTEPTDVETIDEFYEDSEDTGIVGKILVGGATIAAGAAVGFAIKNRDKIKQKFSDLKEARKAKKVAKLMDKLNKLAPEEPKTEAEKEE